MALYHSPLVVTDGLVLYVDAANRKSYPGTGTLWTNLVNSSLSTSLYNGVSFSTASIGTMVMDGTDDYIAGPSANDFGGLSEQALEIWVKSSGLGPGKSIGGLICPDYGQISYIAPDGNIVYYLYSTDAGYPGTYVISIGTSGVNIFDNQWHHIICTRGSAGCNIYVDGVSRVSAAGGNTWSGANIWSGMATQIGNNPNNVYYNLLGSIGLVRIYKKYLSQAEVTQNFNALRTRFGI